LDADADADADDLAAGAREASPDVSAQFRHRAREASPE
jgi:hypothetical protein